MAIVPESYSVRFLQMYYTFFGLAAFAIPDKMMSMYQADTPSGAKNQRLIMAILSLLGFSLMWFAGNIRSGTKFQKAEAKGVAGFGAFLLGIMNLFFGVTRDIPFATKVGMPLNGVYFNLGIAAFTALCGFGLWSDAGKKMPNCFNCLKFGSLQEAAISYAAIVQGFFGLMMVFAPDMMNAQYFKAGYTEDTMNWVNQLMGAWGQVMIATSAMHCSFNGVSDDDTKTRVCRDIWINNSSQMAIWIVWRQIYISEGNIDDAQAQMMNMGICFVGSWLGGFAYSAATSKDKKA